ncbi:class I adenylate-forming enzyme family protein [Rhizorhabdus dicambivorans]|uniref:Fatty-acid--CoA ligase n=1 Tax=Rhizorhabdus dicambivorans TaxID=1850238 RepID=A0A2A4FUC8_9SPHN|nr:long-chain-fatty-acid--CoA ligase [Rhizorhabdus dicambivorans]ATE67266.1 fatty-acid--CoA ligase [Rhizorhabdus dicambivorans]PCE41330.1 fatty-acid--CoA ligase [Rhizorhabdus dicambivorans]
MQLTQSLRRNAELFPSQAALICGSRVTTWAELQQRVARLAAAFRAAGANPGDRIAMLAVNSDRFVECLYAVLWAGCVAIPFNTRWAEAEINFALEDSEPAIMVVDANFAGWASWFAASGVAVFGCEDGLGVPSIGELVSMHEPIPEEGGSGCDLAGIFYTGGTTGRAKGVMLSHAQLITAFLAAQAVTQYASNAVVLHIAPMFHIAGAGMLFGMTMLGATHVILSSFDPATTIKSVEEHRVTVMLLVPTMISMLCERLRQQPADMSSIQRLTYGASPISSAVLEAAMELLPNARFVQAYGQTELSACLTVLDHEDHLAGRGRSAGRVAPTMSLRIVNRQGEPVPVGVVGEIEARAPGVMLGYWKQPNLTAQTIVDGWLKTGDAGRVDEAGYLYLEDRVKDMIITGGENVYSAEVENALMSHPGVAQCAVIGVPDERWGERVHAIIQTREGIPVTESDLKAHCEPLIANYKRPKSFELRATSLPLSGAGKIMKAELRRPFWEGRSRQIG